MADYESALDAIWRDLRQHLEWADGFLLILLYTRHPAPARELLHRAESLLQARGLVPLLLRPRDAAQAHAIVQTVIAARPEPGGERPAIWLDLWERSSDADWQAQRYETLARLNERRFLLEQKVGRPLVLILPEEDRSNMHVLAPDLWTVRSYSVGLPVPETRREATVEDCEQPAAIDTTPAPIELEWQRLLAAVPETERAARLDPRDGIFASRAALERGALAEAIGHAELALTLARARASDDPSRQRELARAYEALGEARQANGELEAAQTAHVESLQIRRQLRTMLDDTPQALRDLSVSLDCVGNVARELGDLEAARAAYAEDLEICRQLRTAQGDMPRALRELSVSLNHVGQVSRDLGDLEVARAAYAESLALHRQLRQSLGDTPQALRDLSVSLNHVGQVSRALGDPEAARGACAESLEISRQLRISLGDTPGVLDDLARGLAQWGYLQTARQDPAAARAAFQEGGDLAARLVALQPDHPGYRKLQAQLLADLEKLPP